MLPPARRTFLQMRFFAEHERHLQESMENAERALRLCVTSNLRHQSPAEEVHRESDQSHL